MYPSNHCAGTPGFPLPRRSPNLVDIVCDQQFLSLSELNKHNSVHPPSTAIICDKCGRTLKAHSGFNGLMQHKFSHKYDEERQAAI